MHVVREIGGLATRSRDEGQDGGTELVEPGGITLQDDRMALDSITSAVPPEMVASLALKDTAAEAWKAVKSMRLGSDAVRKMKVQCLRQEFESICFKSCESIDDFVMRLSNLVAAMCMVDEIVEERKVVEKLLRVTPKRLATVAIAIEVTANFDTLTLEDVGGRLRAADDDPPPPRADGALYLTEEQWEARRRERRARSSGARHGEGGKKGGRSGGHGDDNDDDDGASSVRSGMSGRGRSSSKGKCFNYGVRGHFSKECPKPRKEQALYGNADEEPMLL